MQAAYSSPRVERDAMLVTLVFYGTGCPLQRLGDFGNALFVFRHQFQ